MAGDIGSLSRRVKKKRLKYRKLEPVPSYRLFLVFIFLCLPILGLMGRMAVLQVLQSSTLQARARARQTDKVRPLGNRRSIADRTGKLIAIDEQRYRLWAHPRYFNFPGDRPDFLRDPKQVAEKLSNILSVSSNELYSKMNRRDSGIKIASDLSQEQATKIRQLRISGLDLEPYLERLYPQGFLYANVVGFLNQERIPQAGLEQSLNKQLLVQEKTHILRRGGDGTPLPDDLTSGIFHPNHSTLQLTLDSRLQELAFNTLKEQISNWKAKRGVAIVMDSTNGELLALASIPTYNPNKYWNFSPILFKEWSVQDLFEPGSTFKPINLALALQERVVDFDHIVDDPGKMVVGGWPIHNHDRLPNGVINLAQVLQVSSNVGMVKVMSKLDPGIYWDWLHRLGIDVKPITDLPGAVAGQLKNKEDFVSQPIEPAVASYGQGFSLTPLKLIQLHALLVNGGYLVNPRITKNHDLEDSFNDLQSKNSTPLFRPEVTEYILESMQSVVDLGTGFGVKIPGYQIGGKTGTAEKVVNGSYLPGVKICSFVANLPLDNPRYVVLVVVDEPIGENAYGSTVALPVAKKIIEGLLVLEKIPPSNNKKSLRPAGN